MVEDEQLQHSNEFSGKEMELQCNFDSNYFWKFEHISNIIGMGGMLRMHIINF